MEATSLDLYKGTLSPTPKTLPLTYFLMTHDTLTVSPPLGTTPLSVQATEDLTIRHSQWQSDIANGLNNRSLVLCSSPQALSLLSAEGMSLSV